MATETTNTLTAVPSILTRKLLTPHRSRGLLLTLLQDSETCDLVAASKDIFCALVPYANALRIRNVSRVPVENQIRAHRPVVGFSAPWPGRAAFEVTIPNAQPTRYSFKPLTFLLKRALPNYSATSHVFLGSVPPLFLVPMRMNLRLRVAVPFFQKTLLRLNRFKS